MTWRFPASPPRPGLSQYVSSDLVVIVLDLRDSPEDPIAAWVVELGVALFERLRAHLSGAPARSERVAIVIITPDNPIPSLQPAIDAAIGMVRGAILSLAPECPQTRLTSLLVSSKAVPELEPTLDFLAGDGASYITGASLKIRSTA
jgi:hypothetical protein